MSLHIENEEPCSLAHRERLERERRRRSLEARLRRMRAIAERCADLLREGGPPIDHGDLLYDERGLPR